MKAYPAYKDSGLKWLPQIPAHWEPLPNIALFDERIERGFISDELLSVTQDRGIIKQSELQEKKDSSNEDKSAYKKVRVGDIAYNKMRMWQGAVGYSAFEGIISPAYVVLRPKRKVNSRYYHYLFRTPTYVNESYRNSYGICDDQLSLRFFNFKRMAAIFPPVDEQDAIVAFLAAKEVEIQKFIANQRRQIDLIREYRTSITNRVLLNGLSSTTCYRSSSVPWAPRIPQLWTMVPIKRLLSKMDYGTSEATKDDGPIRVLTMGNIQDGEVTGATSGYLNSIAAELVIERHDLLFTRTNGNPELVGKVGIFRGVRADNVSFASYLVRLRVKQPHNPEWLHLMLNSAAFWPFARSHALVNLQTNLNSSRYGQFCIPVPPPSEQQEIVDYLRTKRNECERVTIARELAIRKVEEYRTALISAAVTGKIDVRNM